MPVSRFITTSGKFIPPDSLSTSLPAGTLAVLRLPESNRPFVIVGNLMNLSDLTVQLRVTASTTITAIEDTDNEIQYERLGGYQSESVTTDTGSDSSDAGDDTVYNLIAVPPRGVAKFAIDTLQFTGAGVAKTHFLLYVEEVDGGTGNAFNTRLELVHFEGEMGIIVASAGTFVGDN